MVMVLLSAALSCAGALSARVAASPRALWFERVKGYDMGVVSGILGSRNRMAASLDCDHRDIGKSFLRRLQTTHRPVMISTGPVKEVIRTGNEALIQRIPEDKRGIVPADYPPEKLRAWLGRRYASLRPLRRVLNHLIPRRLAHLLPDYGPPPDDDYYGYSN